MQKQINLVQYFEKSVNTYLGHYFLTAIIKKQIDLNQYSEKDCVDLGYQIEIDFFETIILDQ